MKLQKPPEILIRTLIRITQIITYLVCFAAIIAFIIGCILFFNFEFKMGYWILVPIVLILISLLGYALARQDVNRFKEHKKKTIKKRFNDIN